MKDEALKLADSIDEFAQGGYSYKPSDFLSVSAMIRRLVEELDKPHKYDPETGEPLIDGYPLFSGLPRGKPLSDEEIMELWYPLDLHDEVWVEESVLVNFARAILRKAWD